MNDQKNHQNTPISENDAKHASSSPEQWNDETEGEQHLRHPGTEQDERHLVGDNVLLHGLHPGVAARLSSRRAAGGSRTGLVSSVTVHVCLSPAWSGKQTQQCLAQHSAAL